MKIFTHRTLTGAFLPGRSSGQSVRQVLTSRIVFHEGCFTTTLVDYCDCRRITSIIGLHDQSEALLYRQTQI